MAYSNYNRRKSSIAQIGDTSMGGENPIRTQSMADVLTMDTEVAVAQAIRMIEVGAEYVCFTAQGGREARNLGEICKQLDEQGYTIPSATDTHFNPRAADAATGEAEKVCINPGNYVDKVKTFSHLEYTDEEYAAEIERICEWFVPFLNVCKAHGTATRIGVNHDSLSDRIMSRYGDTPEGTVASCTEFLRICREENFPDVVISIRASNTVVMIRAVRLLVRTMEVENMHYPLHLGVTEAGGGEDGCIKSAVGIGTLLCDSTGDTVRVSLSENPEAEMPVARKLVDYIKEQENHRPIEASMAPGFDTVTTSRRISRVMEGIGGTFSPVVISDCSSGDFRFGYLSLPDRIYIGKEDPDNLPDSFRLLVDVHFWKERPDALPCFIASEAEELKDYDCSLKFIHLTYMDLTDHVLEILKADKTVAVLLSTHHRSGADSQCAAMHKLPMAGCNMPVVLHRDFRETDVESLQLESAADFGTLLLDGFGDGSMLHNEGCEAVVSDRCMFGILQATRTRISKTEYISCPSCGHTLYDLQTTITRIKEATSHLKGLKTGIMGCIVSGPGEMVDADYGYVGAGYGQISLYKGKECVLKNILEEDIAERLARLIKENGDWVN